MKSNLYQKFAVLLVGLTVSATAFADVKIKTRRTASGQTMENTVLIKGKRQRTESMNGQIISVTQCDLRRDLQISPATQTYLVSMFDNVAADTAGQVANASNTPTTKGGLITTLILNKDTDERKQLFGYTARHIITTIESDSSPEACSLTKSKMQIDGWYIDADFALDCSQNRSYANYNQSNGGCQDKTQVKTVGAAIKKGYPVLEKMTMFDESGKESFSTTNEVVELSKATLDAELFDAPASYREVKNSAELYASVMSGTAKDSLKPPQMPNAQNNDGENASSNPAINRNIKNMAQTKSNGSYEIGAKKEGTIRIGLANVKIGAVGDGMNATELAGAIQNTLGDYLKGSKVELIPLEAKLASALENEAREKQCDFVLYAQVSHKKGGGFGMFKSIAPVLSSVAPMAGMSGSMAGAVAGSVASTAIYSAAGATSNVKAKDEITLDINVKQLSSGAAVLTRQYKSKAKSGGEDIISPIIEQAAQAILDATAK